MVLIFSWFSYLCGPQHKNMIPGNKTVYKSQIEFVRLAQKYPRHNEKNYSSFTWSRLWGCSSLPHHKLLHVVPASRAAALGLLATRSQWTARPLTIGFLLTWMILSGLDLDNHTTTAEAGEGRKRQKHRSRSSNHLITCSAFDCYLRTLPAIPTWNNTLLSGK